MDPQARPAVEKIIALKRHEQPPPGYFRLLPERIIHRIEQGEGRSIFWETWGLAFRVRPVLAYALGLTVCAALTAGIWFVPRMDRSTVAANVQATGGRWNPSEPRPRILPPAGNAGWAAPIRS